MSKRITGVLSPVITPFGKDYTPDAERFIRQCRWLLGNDVGLAVFGTNSEANSLSVMERMDLLEQLVESGADPARLMPGTGACALPEAVQLTAHAVKLGCAGVLMLPPFYYKGVSDEGLFRSFSEVIQRVGDSRLKVYLYHIPPVAQVGISLGLIERLLSTYPGTVAGIKDSSGDPANMSAMLDRFAPQGFDVFAGTETLLLANMQAGGAGCISATANVNPGPIAALFRQWQDPDASQRQAALDAVRAIFAKYPMIPALKAAVAHWSGEAQWRTVRPPLAELETSQAKGLIDELTSAGFSIDGLRP